MSNLGIVILAAGDGKRMKTGIPKVMNLLRGEPLIAHVVDHVMESGLVEKPVVVVAANHTLVQEYLGEKAIYVVQEKQLGTGHATACAENELKGKTKNVMVLYGDVPLITSSSIKLLALEHERQHNTITLATVSVPNFDGWFGYFNDFGRVIRNDDQQIIKIVEQKDASPEEIQTRELNTGCYCFNAEWLWMHINLLTPTNTQTELYLTDLIALAISQNKKLGIKIGAVSIDPKEAVGINTKEHLEIAEKI